MSSPIRVTRNGSILEVTLDRPKVNAIDCAMSRGMGALFQDFERDPALLCAIVTGAGRYFSAGWDLKAAASGAESESSDFGPGGFAGITEAFTLTKPVIAAVNGPAIGAGFELMLACDVVVANAEAYFSLPEAELGVMADAGGVQRLPRRLPYAIAMELLLTGRRFTAAEAAALGLVNAVRTGDAVLACARELAARIVRGAPLAVRAIKAVVQGSLALSVEETFRAMRAGYFPLYQQMLASEDRIEGPKAFVEKRSPRFTGQ